LKVLSFFGSLDWSILAASAIPGLVAGLLGILGCIVCLVLLRKRRLAAERSHGELRGELRGELQASLSEQKSACLAAIEQVRRHVAFLESSAQDIDIVTGGLTRPLRAQAMELLRSGMPAEKISQKLGIARREMRLIAQVSRTLLLE
jgi:hypothetical protein